MDWTYRVMNMNGVEYFKTLKEAKAWQLKNGGKIVKRIKR